ncbi:MAG: glycosyltransferase family 39 protein [Caldilineaceae bacterium]|nr:glycosyltransferase family 39 protein [Caldilineaceae bacterium]
MIFNRLPRPALTPRLIEGAILLIAVVVRFWRLGYHSVWFDEAISLKWAGYDIGYTWATTFALVQDKHPPVYYVALGLWQDLLAWMGLDHSDSALRALGSALGVLTVWGMLRLTTALSGRATGYLTSLLVALSPLLTWYSQELRMFQPATTGLVWGAVALWQAWQAARPLARFGWWLLMIIAIEAALYSYLFSAFLLPAAGLTLLVLFWRDRDLRRFLEGCLALLVTGLLFLPLARNAWSVNEAESTPGQAFADFGANLLRLLHIDTIWRVDWPQPWINAALLLFALLLLLGLLLPWRKATSQPRLDQPWLWLWIGIPLLIANLLLARSGSIFAEDRYLLFMAPFVLWGIARGATALGSWRQPFGWAGGLLSVLVLLAALPPLWTPARVRESWRSAADYISTYTAASPNLPTSVVTHVAYTYDALAWYLRQAYDEDTLPIFALFNGTLTEADIDTVVAPPLNGIVDFGSATLWLTQSHLEGVDDQRVVEGWLNRNFPLITEQYPAGIKLTGYILQGRMAQPPTLGPTARQLDVELQPGLRLAACEIMTPMVSARDEFMHPPSGWVHMRLWWQATAPLLTDYTATAKVIGPEGVWGDKLPRDTESLRMWPTSTWTVGEFVRDELDINLNPLTPAATYPVVIGVADALGQPIGETVECGQVTIR